MSQTTPTTSNKQSLLIGALSGALILAIGAAGFLYMQKGNPANAHHRETTSTAVTDKAPGADVAFKTLFGRDYHGKPVKTDGDKLTEPGFSRDFEQGGKQYHTEVFYSKVMDETGNPIESDDQGVLLSATNYVKTDKDWKVLSRQKYFGEIGKQSVAPSDKDHGFTELKLSDKSVALLSDIVFGEQGYYDTYKQILVFIDTGWTQAGKIQVAADNDSACDKDNTELTTEERANLPPCYAYTGTIAVKKGSNDFFPDLVVKRSGTEMPEESDQPVPARNVTYQYIKGEYVLKE